MKYGEDAWDNVRRLAGLDSPDFAVHQVYPEQLLGRFESQVTFFYFDRFLYLELLRKPSALLAVGILSFLREWEPIL